MAVDRVGGWVGGWVGGTSTPGPSSCFMDAKATVGESCSLMGRYGELTRGDMRALGDPGVRNVVSTVHQLPPVTPILLLYILA